MPRTRTVVVTGASAGVGRAVALAFASRGWQVGLIARGADGLASARADVEAAGGRALAITADIGDAAALDAAADQVERELGPVDVWVNNAMVTVYAPVVDVTPAEFEQVTRVTYLGQVFGTQAALRHMRPRNRGTIVFVGSALAYRSIPFQSAYCAAKAATRGFVDSLRSELLWENSRVRLTHVHLPAVNTPQFDWARNKLGRALGPVPPIFQPEAIAAAVVKAALEAPRELWVGWPTVKAIGAQVLAPGLADRFLGRTGFDGETRDGPASTTPDNLFAAGTGDPGARGRFDAEASRHAVSVDPAWLRGALGIVAAGAAVLAVSAFRGKRARIGRR